MPSHPAGRPTNGLPRLLTVLALIFCLVAGITSCAPDNGRVLGRKADPETLKALRELRSQLKQTDGITVTDDGRELGMITLDARDPAVLRTALRLGWEAVAKGTDVHLSMESNLGSTAERIAIDVTFTSYGSDPPAPELAQATGFVDLIGPIRFDGVNLHWSLSSDASQEKKTRVLLVAVQPPDDPNDLFQLQGRIMAAWQPPADVGSITISVGDPPEPPWVVGGTSDGSRPVRVPQVLTAPVAALVTPDVTFQAERVSEEGRTVDELRFEHKTGQPVVADLARTLIPIHHRLAGSERSDGLVLKLEDKRDKIAFSTAECLEETPGAGLTPASAELYAWYAAKFPDRAARNEVQAC